MDLHPRPRLPRVTRRGPAQVREATSLALAGAPGVAIEGPTQFDAAVDAEVAAIKMKVPAPSAARSRNRSVLNRFAEQVADIKKPSCMRSGHESRSVAAPALGACCPNTH
jgi:hypothetical protein